MQRLTSAGSSDFSFDTWLTGGKKNFKIFLTLRRFRFPFQISPVFLAGKFLLPFNLSAEVVEDHKTGFNADSNSSIAILSRPLSNGRATNLYLKFAAPTTT